MYTLTFLQLFICYLLLLIAFLQHRSAYFLPKQNCGNYISFSIIVILYSTFGFNGGDFYNYYKLYDDIVRTGFNIHLEEFYYFLIRILPKNYYVWRFVVWGLATFCFILINKRIKSPANLSCLVFVLILMMTYSNLRNALGYLMLYYSITFISKPIERKYLLSLFLGIVGVICSLFLHKSMPLYIIVLLISFIHLKKWMIICSLLCFPLFYSSFHRISELFLNFSFVGEQFQTVGASYLDSTDIIYTNANGYIRLIIERAPILLVLGFSVKQLLCKKIDRTSEIFITCSYWLIYISFLFFNQETSASLSERFWNASLFPLTLALPKIIYQQRSSFLGISYYLLIFSNLFIVLLSFYKL